MKIIDNNLKEVYIVLEKFNLIDQLPQRFVEYITENKNDEYDFQYEEEKKLIEQNISEETKQILTVIYQDFLCTEEQNKEINKTLIENEKRKQEELSKKYSYENLFPTSKEDIKKEEVQLIEYKEESFITKIINKVKKFLKIKN